MLKYINMKNLILILFIILAVGCASQSNNDLGPPYNINALSSAESPKILVLPPKVQITIGPRSLIETMSSNAGLIDIDWMNDLQNESEKDRFSSDIQSILRGYLDFIGVNYFSFNESDDISASISDSSLLNIHSVSETSFDKPKKVVFESLYLAPETVEELKIYTADYVLATVAFIQYLVEVPSFGHGTWSGYGLVLFNAKTGRVVWLKGYGNHYLTDGFPPKIDIITDIYKFRGEMTSEARLKDEAQNFIMGKWGAYALTQFPDIIPRKFIAFSTNHTFDQRLECLWDARDSVGLSKFRETKGFQLDIDLDRKIARYSFSDWEMKLKVTSHQSNITLDSAFDDKFSISLNEFEGKWSGPNRVGEKTFTCSDTSVKAKLAASPIPLPPEGHSVKKDIKDTLAPLKKECQSLGYKEETEQFGACVLKLLDNS